MSAPTKYMDLREFLDSGLLFEINRTVLHPLGLAMEVTVSSEDPSSVTISGIWDCRDEEEGVTYAPETFVRGSEKYQRFLDESGGERLRMRARRLGFVLQTKPEG
jgi:hypothetical protein